MLFDLRGRHRRRVVKVIYLGLAVLIGGGLIFFGIGGATGNGGLLDAFKDSSSSAEDAAKDRRDDAAKKTTAQPQNAGAWATLAETEYQLAGQSKGFGADASTGQVTYTGAAKSHLEAAKRAWARHLQLAGDKPDLDRAAMMANVFIGLEDFAGAVSAQEIVLEGRGDQAGYGDYGRLATFAYQAGQTRKGDLASEKAVELAPKDQKDAIKASLAQQKAQAGASAGQSPTPTAPSTTSTTSTTGS